MKRVLVVFGTRPEAIKMCPLVLEMRRRDDLEGIVCITGQHREMLNQVLNVFGVEPDYNLDIMSQGQTLYDITSKVLNGMKKVLEESQPDIVLVHGDTTTSFAAALAAFYQQIPVGHVEAGLRTYDLKSPYPEEYNRQAVGIIADYHFAPTETAKGNLVHEGKKSSSIYVTGNTVIDALQMTVDANYKHPELDWVGSSRLILVTAHRRENLGEPMHRMFKAIRRIVEEVDDVKVLYPIHCNPIVREIAETELADCDRIRLIEPLEVLDFHNFMEKAYLILTDSGGIQEEAPAMGKPVLVMRNTTERPEGLKAGTLKLVGTDEEKIYQETRRLLVDSEEYLKMSRAINPYGDGTASVRICDVIEKA